MKKRDFDNDHLGLVGKTGNASSKKTAPHIHIQSRPANDFGRGSWKNYAIENIDPKPFGSTLTNSNLNYVKKACIFLAATACIITACQPNTLHKNNKGTVDPSENKQNTTLRNKQAERLSSRAKKI